MFGGTVDINNVINSVFLPLVATILCGIASAVLTMAYAWLRKKWGIEIEAKDREALHSAIVSGINLGVAKTGKAVGPIAPIQVGNPMVKIAVEYALRSVPDAIRRFGLTEAKVEQMVLAKVPQVMGQTSPSVSPPVSS